MKTNYTLFISIFLLSLSITNDAFAKEPSVPVVALFDAMRAHDGDKLKVQFTDSAMLQRVTADGTIQTSDLNKFAASISKTTSYLDEKLLSVSVHQSGNLATVWTPYVFYRDQALSHCGVNSFQVIETKVGWQIHYLIDNVYNGDCNAFIKRMKEESANVNTPD